ncbi:MAG: hypothetical protein OEW67_00480 [Cyclobacteriaceae bacterium]|nr:hypothetical protein [Cyclobacteriaceae bacterium]
MINTELIDRYLGGEMTAEEMTGFEQTLSTDPLLNKEFLFQKEIVDGIKLARKRELKNTLNTIDITGGTSSSIWNAKTVTAAIVTVGGILTYMMFPINEQNTEGAIPKVIENTSTEYESQKKSEVEIINITPTVSDNTITNHIKADDESQEVFTKKEIKEDVEIVNTDVMDDFGDFEEDKLNHADAPENFMNDKGAFEHSTIKVEINNNKKKYSFHYQLKDNTLFLYGNFTKIYEVLEFKNNSENDLFFYYNNKYYDINENQNSITLLEEMTLEETTDLKQKIYNGNEAKSQ